MKGQPGAQEALSVLVVGIGPVLTLLETEVNLVVNSMVWVLCGAPPV
jgi:hypothetical protein